MATNVAMDDNLIEDARRAGGHKTKKEAVTAALAEYLKRRKQLRILEAFGSIDFDAKYDYKAERRRTRSRICRFWSTLPSGLWPCGGP
jgi:Arc/MetJ family transcription regulator